MPPAPLAPPPSVPPGNKCNGKFLLELVDDSALFIGLFLIIGFVCHAWLAVSTMPSRGEDDQTRSAVAPADEAALASGSSSEIDLDAEMTSFGKGFLADQPVPETLEALIASHRALQAQVGHLVAREGRAQGLLVGGDALKGRRMRAGVNALGAVSAVKRSSSGVKHLLKKTKVHTSAASYPCPLPHPAVSTLRRPPLSSCSFLPAL